MTVRILTKTLLVIYGLSIMGYGMLEVSHGTVHSIKNKFHNHVHDHHHNLDDHTSALLYAAATSPSQDDDSISPFNSYFLFFAHATPIVVDLVEEPSRFFETFERLISFYSTPLVPPPLS